MISPRHLGRVLPFADSWPWCWACDAWHDDDFPAPGEHAPALGFKVIVDSAARILLFLPRGHLKSRFYATVCVMLNMVSIPSEIPVALYMEKSDFGSAPARPGMRAIATFAKACFRKQTLTVSALPELTKEESYFAASLNLLTKGAIRDSRAQK